MKNIAVYLDVVYEKNWYRDLFKALIESDPGLTIFAIERPVTLLGFLFSFGRKRPELMLRRKGIVGFRPLTVVHERIAFMIKPLAWLNRLVVEYQLRLLTKGGLEAAWIFHPYQLDYLSYLTPKTKIYQIYDDYYFREWDKVMIQKLEARVLSEADVVYVSSAKLLPRYSGLHGNLKLMPNGVSERFKLCRTRDELLKGISKLKKPRICTWGYVSHRLDFDLIKQLAENHPDWSFVFLGECGQQARPVWEHILKLCPNIHHYEKLNWANLAAYLHEMDVLFIPHVKNDFNAAASPVRFIQALAIGKPIIVPALPYSEPHKDLVYFAERAEEYAEHIDRLLGQGEDSGLSSRRIKYADDNSWENKARQIKREICV